MIKTINAGDKFYCRLSFSRPPDQLYTAGEIYTSLEDHCITDDHGQSQFGWNLEILNHHFVPSDLKPELTY